jgi:hypothetical protein
MTGAKLNLKRAVEIIESSSDLKIKAGNNKDNQ